MSGFTRSARGRIAIVAVTALAMSGGGIAATATLVAQSSEAGASGPVARPAAAAPDALAWVTRSDDSVGTMSTTANKKVGDPVAMETEPFGVALTPDGASAYVTAPNFGAVDRITTADRTFHPNSICECGPVSIATSPDGAFVYVADASSNSLFVIDTADDSVVDNVSLAGTPSGIAVAPDGNAIYVSEEGDGGGFIEKLQPTEGGYSHSYIDVGDNPLGLAVTPDGNYVYAANKNSDTLTKISTADDTTFSLDLPSGTGPDAVAISPDGSTVYVTGDYNGSVAKVTVDTNSVSDPLILGGIPIGVAVTPDGDTIYVATQGNLVSRPGGAGPMDETTTTTVPQIGPKVFAIGADGFSVIKKIAMSGVNPNGIAIAPDQAPVAALAVAPGPVGQPSTFDASASTSASSPIASYAWDFGDGNTAVTATPTTTHSYAAAADYTATVTVTDEAGTSTEKVFTGQTMSRNGGPSAVASRDIQVVACTAGEPCSGSVSEGGQTVDISGTSSTDATLSISIGVATVACKDGEKPQKREVVGVNPENFTPPPGDGLHVTIDFDDVHTLRNISICYSSPKPFRSIHNQIVTTGIVPHCSHTPPRSLPCLVSEEIVGDHEVATLIIPATDPKFWAKQKASTG